MKYAEQKEPLDPDCDCYVCKTFTRAYIFHIGRMNEYIFQHYISYHNIYYIQRLMERVRKAIKKQEFDEFKKEFLSRYKSKN